MSLLRNNPLFSTIFIIGAVLEMMIEITYQKDLKEEYVSWILLITWMWETALLQERKKKKNFTVFQTYKFKRQIRVYLIWMDLWLLGLWSMREQTGSCLLCFHHIFQKLEVRESSNSYLKALLLRKFSVIAKEWEEALRFIWGKVIVVKMRWDMVDLTE